MKIKRDDLGKFMKEVEKTTRKRSQEETKMQTTFALWCGVCLPPDVLWLSIPNECPKEWASRLLAMGMRPGAADFLIIYHHIVLFIEFKTKKGVQSDDQMDFEVASRRAGASYVVCRSSNSAIKQLKSHGIPHREKDG